jgi:hypothetical protein
MSKTSVNESINPKELMGLTHLAISVGSKENVDKLKKNLKAIAMR